MYAQVRVLENAHAAGLVFFNRKHAQQFLDFTETYIFESGPGNGYGAYWGYRSDPIGHFPDAPMYPNSLRYDLIQFMALHICDARAARQVGLKKYPEYAPQVGVRNGVITFSFNPAHLPPRIQPQAGDLARVVDNSKFERVMGRVRGIIDESVHLELIFGDPGEEIILPKTQVMKIYDFWKD